MESTWILGSPVIWSSIFVVEVDDRSDLQSSAIQCSTLVIYSISRLSRCLEIQLVLPKHTLASIFPTQLLFKVLFFVLHIQTSKPIPPRLIKRPVGVETPWKDFWKFAAKPNIEVVFGSRWPKSFPWPSSDFCCWEILGKRMFALLGIVKPRNVKSVFARH